MHGQLERSQLLDFLWGEQKKRGHVSADAMDRIARELDITPAEVREVMSFYTMFSEMPVGKHHIQVCIGPCCRLKGADEILSHIKEKLGLDAGTTSDDGMYHLSTVECLGSCGTAPVVMVGEECHENVTREKIGRCL